MTEEYELTILHEGWATFKPPSGTVTGRQLSLSLGNWKRLGKPTSILVTVEGLEPFKFPSD